VELEIEPNEEDALAYYAYRYFTSPTLQRWRARLLVAPVAVLVGSIAISLIERNAWPALAFGGLALIWGAVRWVLAPRRYLRAVRQELAEAGRFQVQRPVVLRICEGGLEAEEEHFYSMIAWAGIREVKFADNRAFVVLTPGSAIVVPLDRASRGDPKSFLREVEARAG
jgi:hypothetical protein